MLLVGSGGKRKCSKGVEHRALIEVQEQEETRRGVGDGGVWCGEWEAN
jgi:hypothetical protein